MKARNHASQAAVDMIKAFEGYRRSAAELADGRWTIGYGHTRTARRGVEVSPEDAEALLIYDLIDVQQQLNDWIFTPLTQNQFDALVAFAFNIGLDSFRISAVLKRVNEGAMVQAASALEMWRRADLDGERIVVDGLVRRRAAEKLLFLTPPHGWVPVPTPVVRPRIDLEAEGSLSHPAIPVTVTLDGERAEARRDGKPADPATPAPSAPETGPETGTEPTVGLFDKAAFTVAAGRAETTQVDMSTRPVRRPPPPVHMDVGGFFDEPEPPRGASLLILGVIGVVVFCASVLWGVSARGPIGAFDPMVVASVLGFIGIGCVACAVYFFLVRLGEPD